MAVVDREFRFRHAAFVLCIVHIVLNPLLVAPLMSLNFKDPQDRLIALIKLRGSLDGAPVLWWYKGSQYGVVDRQPTLLWQVEGAQLGKYIKKDDGSYDHIFRDIMFYVNPVTDEVIKSYTNPYTSRTHEPPVMRMGPFTTNINTDGQTVELPPNMPPGSLIVDWRNEPVTVQGGDVYIRESATTKIANPARATDESAPEYFFINDFFTLIGRVADIEDDSKLSVPARTSYQSLNEWTPWLEMEKREGAVFGRGDSVKLADYSELPETLRKNIEAEEPGFFEDPEFTLWDRAYTPLNQ